MRVGLDARLAGRGFGISTALRGLATALSGSVEVVWFGEAQYAPANVFDVRGLRGLKASAVAPLSHRTVKESGLDLLHFPGNVGWIRPGPVPFVLTIQDLIYMDTGFAGRSWRQRIGHRYLAVSVPRAARASTRIAVPSRATEAALERVVPEHPPVDRIPWGVTPPDGWSPGESTSPPRYVAAFSAPDPRKQLNLVLEAWRRLRSDGLELWLVGGAPVPRSTPMADHSDRGLRRLGYVTSRKLWRVLSGARALLYPTTAEGFGFPVIEGMAAGTPVVTGLCEATREVGGDAVLRIDPTAPAESMARAVRRLESEPALRSALVGRGRQRAAEFTWERTAQGYLDTYRAAVERPD